MPRPARRPGRRDAIRLAVVSDVHGNLPALEAAFDRARGLGVDTIVHAGDLINGPASRECLELCEAEGIAGVGGNHEGYVLHCDDADAPEAWQTDRFDPARWTRATLSSAQISAVAGWPELLRPHADVAIVHAAPGDRHYRFAGFVGDRSAQDAYAPLSAEIVVCGHTHREHARRTDGKLIINMGSTGAPLLGDPRPRLLLLEKRDGSWSWELLRVPYDPTHVLELARRHGWLALGGVAATMVHEMLTGRPSSRDFIRWWSLCASEDEPVDAYRTYARSRGVEPLL